MKRTNREILKSIISEEIKTVLKENTNKNFKIYNPPYAFEANVRFGTYDEMISNAMSVSNWDCSLKVILGGSFNEKMKRKRDASMLYIGVQYSKCLDWSNRNYGMVSAKTICDSPWEGVYWKSGYFDEEMKQGLFPVSVDWGGKCYVKRGKHDANGNWNEWYEEAEFPY